MNLEGLHRSDPTPATCLLYCCPWSQTGPVGGACLQGEASWSALSRQLALPFPPGRADSLDLRSSGLPPPSPRPRSLAAGKPGAPSCILGNVVPGLAGLAHRTEKEASDVGFLRPCMACPVFTAGSEGSCSEAFQSFPRLSHRFCYAYKVNAIPSYKKANSHAPADGGVSLWRSFFQSQHGSVGYKCLPFIDFSRTSPT